MSASLTVRRLRVDLDAPLPRHWAGDAFTTAFFNALSMSFPVGEQMFIDAMRRGLPLLPPEQHAAAAQEVADFIGQEATHRHVHTRFNAQLARQGLVNHWEARILRRRQAMDKVGPRNWLAVTAATEHLTAVFSEHLLRHPEMLAGAEPRLQALWLWHCSEEIEHRSTAFDLYRAIGGNDTWRLRIFRIVSWHFLCDVLRQTAHNLWRDGSWRQSATWVGAWRLLLGRSGLLRCGYAPWRRYLRADFHPGQADGGLSCRWLAEHGELATPVRPDGVRS